MISVDEVDNSILMSDAYKVPFPMLSDPDAKVHDAYNVSFVVPPEGLAKLKKFGHDISRWSARKHNKLAIPSMFLIGKDGLVKFAHASHDYRTRPKLDDLLPKISEALGAGDKPAAK